MEKLPEANQPDWLQDVVGMDYYGISITDAYLARLERYGVNYVVARLQYKGKYSRTGYWYYDSLHKSWLWSQYEAPKQVIKKAFDDVIKPNFDPDSYTL